MKIVMEEAGQTFIAVIVGLLLLAMVFGVKVGQDTVGVLSAISSVAAVQSEDYGTYVDSDAANAQGKLVGSQLIYDTSKDVIEKNTDVNLLDYIMIQRDDEVITASNLGDGEAIYILDAIPLCSAIPRESSAPQRPSETFATYCATAISLLPRGVIVPAESARCNS